MTSGYVEVRVQGPLDSETLAYELAELGIAGAWEDEGSVHLYWPAEAWRPELLDAVRDAVARLGATAECSAEFAPETDWEALWARSLAPLEIGRRIVVRQSWHAPPARREALDLVIDPRRAFGTGHHASTQLVLEALETALQAGESVLDVGTGSGILAMAALRLGAGYALGLDLDPVAIECAREYARANGFGAELELRAAGLEVATERYDVVVANLDRPTLLGLAGSLATLARRLLIVSGILVEDCDPIAEAFAAGGLAVRRVRERAEWIALEMEPSPALPDS
jgi:ribosomal protein L11 methyltransferase